MVHKYDYDTLINICYTIIITVIIELLQLIINSNKNLSGFF